MRRILASILILTALAPSAGAQYISHRDSLMAVEGSRFEFRDGQLIAPVVLLGAATVIHDAGHTTWDVSVRDAVQNKWRAGKGELKFDDYVQYVPVAMDLGLSFAGVKAERCFVDRVIEGAIAYGSVILVSRTAKHFIDSPRPDGGEHNSFPSGHSCTAFTGAELVRMEYGWGWGAGAYAIAATVGMMRIYNDRHWMSDVLAGAGLGILCAHVGGWLLEPTKQLFGIRTTPNSPSFAVMPAVDPMSGALCASFALQF